MLQARLEAGLTQQDMAELMATHQSTIARMESGRYPVRLLTLMKWAEVTGKRLEIKLL